MSVIKVFYTILNKTGSRKITQVEQDGRHEIIGNNPL